MFTFSLNVPHTKSMLKILFSERGIHLKRRWGQNFLIDQNILEYIVRSSELRSDDIVLEIGAGTGSLTRLLAERARHLFAVEIDRKVFGILSETLQDFTNVTLINSDILKSKHRLHPEIVGKIREYMQAEGYDVAGQRIKVVSNLPYYISTPIIIDLLQGELPINSMILTLQKDITNRLVAKPATKDFGRLSLITKLYADVRILKKLPPDVFWPAPQIDSAIVRLEVTAGKYRAAIREPHSFREVVNAIYVSRRKTILNSLLSLCQRSDATNLSGETDPVRRRRSHEDVRKRVIAVLERVDIEPGRRGEELDVEKLIELSNELLPLMSNNKLDKKDDK